MEETVSGSIMFPLAFSVHFLSVPGDPRAIFFIVMCFITTHIVIET